MLVVADRVGNAARSARDSDLMVITGISSYHELGVSCHLASVAALHIGPMLIVLRRLVQSNVQPRNA